MKREESEQPDQPDIAYEDKNSSSMGGSSETKSSITDTNSLTGSNNKFLDVCVGFLCLKFPFSTIDTHIFPLR